VYGPVPGMLCRRRGPRKGPTATVIEWWQTRTDAGRSDKKRKHMLKASLLALALVSMVITAKAADGDQPPKKRPELTEEQKKLRKELVE